MRVIYLLLFMAVVFPLKAEEDFDRQQIIERIEPVGKVRVEGKVAGQTPVVTPPVVTTVKKEPGQETYEGHCIVCHADGLAGAPKFRNESDWQPRLAKTNLQELVAIAIKGLNAMPPKGTCVECNEDDLKKAIQYMLPKK